MTRFAEFAGAIAQADDLERDWVRKRAGQRSDPDSTGWMPFPLFTFIALLAEAAPAIPQPDPGRAPWFLDVGCGPGSKMLIATALLGLDAAGVESDAEMAAAARELGLRVRTGNAGQLRVIGDYQAVWLNRPRRERGPELDLERKFWREMAPGAVALCANLEAPPPADAFFPVLDSWDPDRYGIWYKI